MSFIKTILTLMTGQADPLQELNAVVGDIANLSLDSNPTTGYSWMIKSLPNSLILVDSSYTAHETGLIGSGGVHTYTFLGQRPGNTTLELIYGQPWNELSWNQKRVPVVVGDRKN